MRRSGDDSRKSLVRDGSEVGHGQAMVCELHMEVVQSNPGLNDDEVLVGINLQVAYRVSGV